METTKQVNAMAEKRLNLPVKKKKNVWFIVLISLLSLVIVVCAAYICYVQMFPNVFYGVSMGDLDFSGKTPAQMNEIISKWSSNVGEQLITIKHEDMAVSRTYGQLVSEKSLAGISDTIMSIGRSEGFFGNIATVTKAIFGGLKVQPSLELDDDAVNGFLNEFAELVTKELVSPGYETIGDSLQVYAGVTGFSIDFEATMARIINKLMSPDETPIEPVIEVIPVEIDAQEIYNLVYHEPVGARLTQNTTGGFDIVPEEVGIDFDLNLLKSQLNPGSGETYTIPLIISKPATTSEDLVGSLFRDVLSSAKTVLNPGLINRTSNVRLAAEAIDGTIIMPGDEFSYNKVVGERTAARGYKEAKIYVANEIVDGLGGGICQISSTLYSCVLHAELEVSQRREHMFRVTYISLGQDATVAWGSVDFRFVNNTDYPIRIDAVQKSDYVYIELRGTLIEPKPYEVKIVSETVSSTPFQTITKIDPALAAGQKRVDQVGSNGYKVNTYRQHLVDGKVVESTFLHTSNYKPANHIVYVSPFDAPIDPDAPPDDTTLPTDTEPTLPPDTTTSATDDTTVPGTTTAPSETAPTSGVDDSMTTTPTAPPDSTTAPPPTTVPPDTTTPPGTNAPETTALTG